jgi:Flp pilus assembly protein TadG
MPTHPQTRNGKASRPLEFTRSWASLRRDAHGATAVEFGLLVLPFMLLLLGVFELGYTFFMMSALDSATRASARAVMTGAVSTAGLSAASFRSGVVCPKLPSNFDCASLFINVSVVPAGTNPTGYYSYVNSNRSALVVPPLDATANKFCPGSGGQYVVLQLLYPVNAFTQLFASSATTLYQGKKVTVLMSTATFKAEPYSGGAAYAGC